MYQTPAREQLGAARQLPTGFVDQPRGASPRSFVDEPRASARRLMSDFGNLLLNSALRSATPPHAETSPCTPRVGPDWRRARTALLNICCRRSTLSHHRRFIVVSSSSHHRHIIVTSSSHHRRLIVVFRSAKERTVAERKATLLGCGVSPTGLVEYDPRSLPRRAPSGAQGGGRFRRPRPRGNSAGCARRDRPHGGHVTRRPALDVARRGASRASAAEGLDPSPCGREPAHGGGKESSVGGSVAGVTVHSPVEVFP